MKHIGSLHSKSTLTAINQQTDIQPNACDIRLEKVFRILPGAFILSEEQKVHRGSIELQPDEEGWFYLHIGSYEVIMENTISVAEGEAGWVIPRSTLNRNGVFLTTGLYDSGYTGVMAAVMHVTTGIFQVKKGTRIGQYLSFDSETLKQYDGSYGFNSDHDKKYGV